MSTTPSQIAALDGLCPQMRAHVPPLGDALNALLPELRAVDRLGLIAERSRLGIDAENLARDAADLLVLREMRIRNDDTGAAEEALLTLIADMRVRVSELIKGRTASLRINTEVSALHADPDADTVDLTDGYRLMAAHPTPRDAAADGLVITDLGLPETGGKVGRITGKNRGGYFLRGFRRADVPGVITGLITDLRTVRGLYGNDRIPDRRLFGLDLENLAEGLDMLATLRGSGVEDDRILSGLSDVRALAESMSARAKRLVDDKVNATLIHTSTASLGITKPPVGSGPSAAPAPLPDDVTAALLLRSFPGMLDAKHTPETADGHFRLHLPRHGGPGPLHRGRPSRRSSAVLRGGQG